MHDIKVRSLATGSDDEHEITCTCGFNFTATTQKYADAVGKRHKQLNEPTNES